MALLQSSNTSSTSTPDIRTLAISVLLASLTFLLLIPLTAYWGSNDDVGMAMLAGGYGIAQSASPGVIHSNVIWGMLVQITDYTLLMYGVIALSLIALAYCLQTSAVPVAVTFLLLLLPAGSLLVYPQFTKTAGFAMLAGIALLMQYAQTRQRWLLLAASLLALSGLLIRDLQALLLLAVALPLIPFQLARDRAALIAAGIVILIGAGALIYNQQFYATGDWQVFQSLNQARAAFTDFNAAELLVARPDLLAQAGYSRSDIFLLSNWYFVDPRLADPERMRALLDLLPGRQFGLDGLLQGLMVTVNLVFLLPLLVAALIFLILKPGPRLAGVWLLLLAALALLGYLGRPAPGRVLLPLYAMVLLMPFLVSGGLKATSRLGAIYAVLVIANIWHGAILWQPQAQMRSESQQLEAIAGELAREDTAVWGEILMKDNLYRPFGDPAIEAVRFYDLGQMTLVPNSRATYLEQQGKGFVDQLLSEGGVRLLTRDIFLPLLAAYCAEHHAGQLLRTEQHLTFEMRGLKGELNTLRCQPSG